MRELSFWEKPCRGVCFFFSFERKVWAPGWLTGVYPCVQQQQQAAGAALKAWKTMTSSYCCAPLVFSSEVCSQGSSSITLSSSKQMQNSGEKMMMVMDHLELSTRCSSSQVHHQAWPSSSSSFRPIFFTRCCNSHDLKQSVDGGFKQGFSFAAAAASSSSCLKRGESIALQSKGSGDSMPPAYNDELRTRTSADEVSEHAHCPHFSLVVHYYAKNMDLWLVLFALCKKLCQKHESMNSRICTMPKTWIYD